MTLASPSVRVGEPLRHKGLVVFPLFSEPNGKVEYRLSDEALADESLTVEEVSEAGSVPDLLVENKGDTSVLFIEGEELVGAKQNRILNTSVLVAAHSKVKIPVSCVEQGRWRYKSHFFGSSGSHSPSKLRHALKASVSESVKQQRGHRSDQGKVWEEVACMHAAHGVESASAAMSDAFDTYQDRVADYRDRLKYVDGAVGVAVGIGDRVVSVDLFDKPSTCERVWNRLLSGVVFDAIEAGEAERVASVADVEELLTGVGDLPWEQAPAIGDGDEYRAESKQGDHASALVVEGTVVHESLVAAV